MKYVIIKNAYKAPVRVVFDYLELADLENPLPHQKKMLDEICDGVEIFEADHWKYKELLKEKTSPGDYLYLATQYGFDRQTPLKLVGINPPKSQPNK